MPSSLSSCPYKKERTAIMKPHKRKLFLLSAVRGMKTATGWNKFPNRNKILSVKWSWEKYNSHASLPFKTCACSVCFMLQTCCCLMNSNESFSEHMVQSVIWSLFTTADYDMSQTCNGLSIPVNCTILHCIHTLENTSCHPHMYEIFHRAKQTHNTSPLF